MERKYNARLEIIEAKKEDMKKRKYEL